MRTDDLILVSVDDHVIEPRACSTACCRPSTRTRRRNWSGGRTAPTTGTTTGTRSPTWASTRWSGRPPEEYGMEPTSLDDIRVGCYDVHERVARHVGQRRARLHVLPVLPPVLRPALRPPGGQGRGTGHGAGLQRLAHRRLVRRRARDGSSPSPSRSSGSPSWRRPRCGAWPGRGVTPSPSPRIPKSSAGPPCTAATGTRCGRPAPTKAPSSACTWGRRPNS